MIQGEEVKKTYTFFYSKIKVMKFSPFAELCCVWNMSVLSSPLALRLVYFSTLIKEQHLSLSF